MSLEPELKFRAPAGKLSELANVRVVGVRNGRRSQSDLLSTYFDTRKHKLRRNGLTLRVRQADGRYIQTVKEVARGSFARGEWEWELDDSRPDLAKAEGTPLERIATGKLRRNLKPVFRTSVHRITRPCRTASSEIELAIDRGTISAGRSSERIAEFELELKRGRAADLFHLAKMLERKAGAQLDLRSKSEQGFLLVDGSDGKAVHAEPIQLEGKLSSHEAFDVIAFSTLRHLSANGDGVRARDAEAVHQMRVGLRRLRAAISLFDEMLPKAGTTRIKTELKWLTGELARARELDVFLKERVQPLARKSGPKRGARAIEAEFTASRNSALEHARRVIGTSRYRQLLIRTLEWLETRRPVTDADAQTSIGRFADDVLERRIRKARKQGRRLDQLSPRARHKLRIKIKKIRYALEFFESLYARRDRKKLRKLAAHLKKIQDALGELNDAMAHEEMAARAALTAPPQNRRARAFASGILVGEEREASGRLMQAARRNLRKLHPLSVEPA
jgi:inorganic triphosphatase YgiF